jgi:hypothetical protein
MSSIENLLSAAGHLEESIKRSVAGFKENMGQAYKGKSTALAIVDDGNDEGASIGEDSDDDIEVEIPEDEEPTPSIKPTDTIEEACRKINGDCSDEVINEVCEHLAGLIEHAANEIESGGEEEEGEEETGEDSELIQTAKIFESKYFSKQASDLLSTAKQLQERYFSK